MKSIESWPNGHLERQLQYYQKKCQEQELQILDFEFQIEQACEMFQNQSEFLTEWAEDLKEHIE